MDSRNSEKVPVRRDKLPNTLLAGSYKNLSDLKQGPVIGNKRGGPGQALPGQAPLDNYPPKGCKDEEWCVGRALVSKPKIEQHGARMANLALYTIWNRTKMGMMIPGEYWFLTLTSSPLSSPSTSEALARKYGQSGLQLKNIKPVWLNFYKNWWRKKTFGAVDVLWAETNEAHGVIHAVMRFPPGWKLIPDEEDVRKEWMKRHKANQIDFAPVKNFDKTANYMIQVKNSTANEFLYQPCILKWAYSRGWLPTKYAAVFGRAWWNDVQYIVEPERSRVLRSWQLAIIKNPDNLERPPRVVEKYPGMIQVIEDYL